MLTRALTNLHPARALAPAARAFSFRFPKHSELFADDYYDPQKSGAEESSTAYDHDFPRGDDFEDFEKPTHRRSTSGGILSTYKKQLNLTADDVMQQDYWTKLQGVKRDMEEKFN